MFHGWICYVVCSDFTIFIWKHFHLQLHLPRNNYSFFYRERERGDPLFPEDNDEEQTTHFINDTLCYMVNTKHHKCLDL